MRLGGKGKMGTTAACELTRQLSKIVVLGKISDNKQASKSQNSSGEKSTTQALGNDKVWEEEEKVMSSSARDGRESLVSFIIDIWARSAHKPCCSLSQYASGLSTPLHPQSLRTNLLEHSKETVHCCRALSRHNIWEWALAPAKQAPSASPPCGSC